MSSDQPTHSLWPAFFLSLAVAISNGLARFAYGLVLPSMQVDLGWSYSTAGLVNTANAFGYMAGALIGYGVLRSVSPSRLFYVGTTVVVLSVFATALHGDLWYLAVVRALAGFGSAWMFTCGASLVSAIYAEVPSRRGTATGLYFSGAGLGMIVSGLFVPAWLESTGPKGWAAAWCVIGIISAVMAVPALVMASRTALLQPGPSSATNSRIEISPYFLCLGAYFLFGAGNNVYLTFLASWISERGQGWQLVSVTWIVLGAGICLSPWIWRRALNSWPATQTLAASLFATAVGVCLALVSVQTLPTVASAFIYGLSLFIAPSAMTVLARSTRPPQEWAAYVSLFTLAFSVGQAVGPWVAGEISDLVGLKSGMMMSALLLFIAAALANAPSQAKKDAVASIRGT